MLRDSLHGTGDGRLEPVDIGRGQAHLGTVGALETAEQAAAQRETEHVRDAGHDLVLHHRLELVEIGALGRVDRQPAAAASGEGPQEVIAYRRFLFAGKMRLQALDEQLRDFAVCGFDIGARWKEQETVHRVALDRRQVVAFRPEQHGEQHGTCHETADPAEATRLRAGEFDDPVRDPVPERMLAVLGRQLAHPVLRRGRQNSDCDEQGCRHADRYREREVGEHLSFDVLQEHDRYEDCDRGCG